MWYLNIYLINKLRSKTLMIEWFNSKMIPKIIEQKRDIFKGVFIGTLNTQIELLISIDLIFKEFVISCCCFKKTNKKGTFPE